MALPSTLPYLMVISYLNQLKENRPLDRGVIQETTPTLFQHLVVVLYLVSRVAQERPFCGREECDGQSHAERIRVGHRRTSCNPAGRRERWLSRGCGCRVS